MKRILLLTLAAVLLLGTALAAPDEASFTGTRRILEYFDSRGITYTYRGIVESTGDELVAIPYSNTAINGQGRVSFTIYMMVQDDNELVHLRIYSLVAFNSADTGVMYRLCNEMNRKYNFVRFYVNEPDSTITAAIDIETPTDCVGEVVLDTLAHMVTISENSLEIFSPYAK